MDDRLFMQYTLVNDTNSRTFRKQHICLTCDLGEITLKCILEKQVYFMICTRGSFLRVLISVVLP